MVVLELRLGCSVSISKAHRRCSCAIGVQAERITGNISLVLEVEMYKAEVEDLSARLWLPVYTWRRKALSDLSFLSGAAVGNSLGKDCRSASWLLDTYTLCEALCAICCALIACGPEGLRQGLAPAGFPRCCSHTDVCNESTSTDAADARLAKKCEEPWAEVYALVREVAESAWRFLGGSQFVLTRGVQEYRGCLFLQRRWKPHNRRYIDPLCCFAFPQLSRRSRQKHGGRESSLLAS